LSCPPLLRNPTTATTAATATTTTTTAATAATTATTMMAEEEEAGRPATDSGHGGLIVPDLGPPLVLSLGLPATLEEAVAANSSVDNGGKERARHTSPAKLPYNPLGIEEEDNPTSSDTAMSVPMFDPSAVALARMSLPPMEFDGMGLPPLMPPQQQQQQQHPGNQQQQQQQHLSAAVPTALPAAVTPAAGTMSHTSGRRSDLCLLIPSPFRAFTLVHPCHSP